MLREVTTRGQQTLTIRGAQKIFLGMKRPALSGFTASFASGRVKAIVGPNGAGKTTLLSVIAGIVNLDSGTVEMKGASSETTSRPIAATLLLDLAPGLYPRMSARQNLRYFGSLARQPPSLMSLDEATRRLESMGLEDLADSASQSLSRGMQQRLSIGIALASNSDVLLLDEPTNGLDIEEARRFVELVRNITKMSALITVLTSHQPDTILGMADEVIFISNGRLVEELESTHLTSLTHSSFVEAYVRAIAEAGH